MYIYCIGASRGLGGQGGWSSVKARVMVLVMAELSAGKMVGDVGKKETVGGMMGVEIIRNVRVEVQ